MYAIIETGGKQYRVSEGDVVFIEKLQADVDAVVEFDKVCAVGKDDGIVAVSYTHLLYPTIAPRKQKMNEGKSN